MKIFLSIIAAVVVTSFGEAASPAEPEPSRRSPEEARSIDAARLVTLAIRRGAPLYNAGQAEACAAVYEVAAVGAAALAGGEGREILEAGLARAGEAGDPEDRAWALRRAFDEFLARPGGASPDGRESGFRVVREAPLPEGFPEPGPLGEVVLKLYPRYRMARVEGGMAAFWTLFGHIKRNEIAMTAPVEMGLEMDGDGAVRRTDMAFLYASPELGSAGRSGRVEVVDQDAMRVLSYGLKGPLSDSSLARARAAIEKRLTEDGRWERAGGWRLMGYNSPMVTSSKRFHEVQLPVRERRAR